MDAMNRKCCYLSGKIQLRSAKLPRDLMDGEKRQSEKVAV